MNPNDATTQPDEAVHLFVDLSNLFYGARAESERRGDPAWAVRLHAGNLHRVLAAGRRVANARLVANREIPAPVLAHFRHWFEVELVEAGRVTGSEQAGDELLQNAMYRTLLSGARGTIVLATGDGAGWREGRGFCPALEAAQRLGLAVEVVAFGASLNEHLRALAAGTGVVVVLDRWYGAVTFLEGLRAATHASVVHRPFARAAA